MLLLEIIFEEDSEFQNLQLVMVQWYDYAEVAQKKRHRLGCPYMKLLNSFDIIPLESVIRNVHVVPDFNKDNRYFINNYVKVF